MHIHRAVQGPLACLALLVGSAALPGQDTWPATPSPQRPSRSVTAGLTPGKAQTEAARIDRLLDAERKRRGVAPNAPVDDPTFLRRAYLAAVGRIPSVAEAEAFLADAAPDKRGRLVDTLLDSAGWTSHEANYWFDLLRVKSRQRQASGEPFAHWIRESLRDGKPYDEFVREMIAAEGPAAKAGNGATGMLLRDMNMPHDAMANTLRVFLGTRIECAQCHNHPFEHWTQRDFYGMAAFFGGLRYRVDLDRDKLQQARALTQGADDRTRRAARQILQTASIGLQGSGTGRERLPQDYAYDDAAPRSPVTARTIFGQQVDLRPAPGGDAGGAQPGRRPRNNRGGRAAERDRPIESRAALAAWLTSAANPRFVTVATNRVWERLFGAALITPLDDIKQGSAAVFPRLQQHLEKLLVQLDFDLRQLQRVLMRTSLFQAAACQGDPPTDAPYGFAGPLVRRMSAEQLWDSLLTLVDEDLDESLREPDARAREIYGGYAQIADATPEELAKAVELRADPAARRAEQRRRAAEQAAEQRARREELLQQARPLQRQLTQARRRDDQQAVAELTSKLAELGIGRGAMARGAMARGGRDRVELLRASDLPQPAPDGHLLRQFGQSDRETIDGSSRDGTVPQALTLLNGFLDQRVLAGQSSLRSRLAAAADPDEQVRVAFVATLSRPPDSAESALWGDAVAQDGPDGLRDLVWVLCNTNEFRFIR